MKNFFTLGLFLYCLAIFGQNETVKEPTENPVSLEEVTYNMLTENAEKEGLKTDKKASKSRMVLKADDYFSKMWYAEASALYEKALLKEENQTYEVMSKAADAYYFNTHMEKAYYWYDALYKKYKAEMEPAHLFNYAHSLKGNGKYGRAKRLMRIYNKKLNDPNYVPTDKTEAVLEANEQQLDLIMGSIAKDVSLKNIALNTPNSDFGAHFYGPDQVVYASAIDSFSSKKRRYKWNDQPYLDLYSAQLNQESFEVKEAVRFSKNVNTKYHEASVSFTPDNKTLFFTRNNYSKKLKRDKDGVNHLKIFMSKKVDNNWQKAVELPFNSDDYSCGHPTVSPDGKQLYFVSDMPGSMGETDVFVVDILENDTFSQPKNLGPEVNTINREMFPFFNGEKLFFASDGHIGLGGLDVFEATYIENEGFNAVKNLGKPINSNKDDFAYVATKDYQKGFFSSNRSGGKGDDDIYSFVKLLPEESSPLAIAGIITEKNTEVTIPKALITLLDANGVKLKEVESDENGNFVFEDLDANTKYVIESNADNYVETSQEINLGDRDEHLAITFDRLKAKIAIEDGIKKIKLDNILFDFDSDAIKTEAALELDKLVGLMQQYEKMTIKIESHTDSRGNNAYNKYLSDRRARATRAYIIDQGIEASRIIEAKGFGEEQLVNDCSDGASCTRDEHRLNRRSEFIVVDM